MEHAYPPTYNTWCWEESLSLMSQGQFISTDVDAGHFPTGYPCLAANYLAQQTMAQYLYEPMPVVCCYRPPGPAWASSASQLGDTVAGPSYICAGATYVPQQMLLAGGNYYQPAPIAYEPANAQEGPTLPYCAPSHAARSHCSSVQLLGEPIASLTVERRLAEREAMLPVPSSQASTSGAVMARSTTSQRRWRRILPQPAGTVASPASGSEGFEGNSLNQQTFTSRQSVRRNIPANGIIPEAVKASVEGGSRAKAVAPVHKIGGKETPYLTAKHKCVECTMVFRRKSDLTRHMLWADAHREGSPVCDQCNKTFSRPDALRNHKRRIHD